MRTKTSITAAALAILAALLALPAGALAGEYFIPEGNSAVTQYATSVPTAGGEKGSTGKEAKKPDKSIGTENAKKLESQGAEGKAAAELAVETSPEPVIEAAPEPQPAPKPSHKHKKQPQKKKPQHKHSGAAAGNSGSQGGSGGSGHPAHPAHTAGEATGQTVNAGSGSSGTAEVAAKAIGIGSPGNFGVLLPLAILGSLAWAVSYAVRRRRHPLP
jgi:outer membrane biosynthesis protein TonB